MKASQPWSPFDIGILIAALIGLVVLVVEFLPVPQSGERAQLTSAVQEKASGPGGSGPHGELQSDASGGGAPPSDRAADQGSTAPPGDRTVSEPGKSASEAKIMQGEGICYEIENSINAMFIGTFTKCWPAAGMEHGTTSLLLISEKGVFSDGAAKKGWLAAVVGAVGYVANQHPEFRLYNVIVSDVAQMKERQAWKLPGETVKSLHRRVHDEEINANQFITGIFEAMREMPIPTKR